MSTTSHGEPKSFVPPVVECASIRCQSLFVSLMILTCQVELKRAFLHVEGLPTEVPVDNSKRRLADSEAFWEIIRSCTRSAPACTAAWRLPAARRRAGSTPELPIPHALRFCASGPSAEPAESRGSGTRKCSRTKERAVRENSRRRSSASSSRCFYPTGYSTKMDLAHASCSPSPGRSVLEVPDQ